MWRGKLGTAKAQDYTFYIAHKCMQRSATKSGIDLHEFSSGEESGCWPALGLILFLQPPLPRRRFIPENRFASSSTIVVRFLLVSPSSTGGVFFFSIFFVVVSSLRPIVCRDLIGKLADRIARLLRGIFDRFLMKYSRSTTKSSFVSQRHLFVFRSPLLCSLPRERGPDIVILVAHFFPRPGDLSFSRVRLARSSRRE